MPQTILLVNTNIVQPPVSPVGLEYVGESLVEAGLPVEVLDLAFEPDWRYALNRALRSSDPVAVGLAVRNTDDSSFLSRRSFLPWIRDVVSEVRRLTSACIVLGGVGFSITPEAVLDFTKADVGIAGDGEEATASLLRCLMNGEDYSHLPNLVHWRDGTVVSNPRANVDLRQLPGPRRRLFDNRKYEQTGAMVGVETKRGCPQRCIYCADPLSKGREVRLRPPQMVADEFRDLVDQGVSWFHLCDSEFNIPIEHARDVCRAMVDSGLGDRVRWYTYCSPAPFDRELAGLMKSAGCAGINFGADSLDDGQLRRLGRAHSSADIGQLVRVLKDEGLNYMFDLLVGGPGETVDTVRATIDGVRRLNVPLVGISAGIRVYRGTPLGDDLANSSLRGGLESGEGGEQGEMLFYLSPELGDDVSGLIADLADGDQRFLLLSAPAEEGSYNYAGDDMLCRLIREGARGAYWDILRQHRSRLP